MVLLLLAIVSFFTAFLLYNGLTATSKRLDATATNLASFTKLDAALTQYVMLNQRLPCPASGTVHTGLSDPNAATTACNSPSGIVPWATLGLSKSDALDSWGRYIAYRVPDGTNGFTQASGFALANCLDESVTTVYPLSGASGTCNSNTHENTISDFFATKGLTVNDRGTANGKVAYVLISMGESGLGAYYPGGSAPMAMPSGASKEFINAGSGGTYWITSASDPSVPASADAHFDDVVSYQYAVDVAHNARVAGSPWPLFGLFNATTLGLSAGDYNTGVSSKKVTASEGPVMVTATGDVARTLCTISESTARQGVTACTGNSGNDYITTNQNEKVSFDFRVTRRFLKIKLTEFRAHGGNIEQAHFAFYNGTNTTPVYAVDKSACGDDNHAVGYFQISTGVDFTRVEVSAGNATADFTVGSIAACKFYDASHPACALPAAVPDTTSPVPPLPAFDTDLGGWCP